MYLYMRDTGTKVFAVTLIPLLIFALFPSLSMKEAALVVVIVIISTIRIFMLCFYYIIIIVITIIIIN